MEELKQILTIEVPVETTLHDWSQGKGKEVIFPELLIGCEELLYHDLEKVYCLKVITYENGRQDNIDFIVRRDGIENTLEKIMEWGLETEHYLLCSRVRDLNTILEKEQ